MKNCSVLSGALFVLLAVSCVVPETPSLIDDDSYLGKEISFTASFGDYQTKTAFQSDETSIWWSPGDAIKVYYGSGSNGDVFSSSHTNEVQKAVFTGTISSFTGVTETGDFNYFWAVYPNLAGISCDGSSVVVSLAGEQLAKAGSFSPNTNVTIAKSPGLALSFYNTCAWFRFTVKQEGIKTVRFRGNNDEIIAGQFSVTMGEDGKPTVPVVVEGQGLQEIVLNAPDGETLTVGEMYYITLLPQVFTKGFTVTFETETHIGSRTIDASSTYLRSKYNTGREFDKNITYKRKDVIDFADESVKAICVNNWDSNHDGELSYTEAAAVNYIGVSPFKGNTSITSFDEFQYFTGLTSLPNEAFKGCSSLTSIVLPERITYLSTGLFYNCSSLISVVVPDDLTSIRTDAFRCCSALENFSIPVGVTSIGECAFASCGALTRINIPYGVTTLSNSVFYGCSSLSSITIPESVTTIAQYALYGCRSITGIIIPDAVSYIGEGAFMGCSLLSSIVIPHGVTTIESQSFRNCSALISVGLPSGLTSIGNAAFDNCGLLTNIGIPTGVTSIGGGAFRDCGSITSISIPSGVTTIGVETFSNCQSLTSIDIPSGVTSIGTMAFYGCKGLTSVRVNSTTPPTGGSLMFDNTAKCPIFVPASSVDSYKSKQYWSDYSSRIQAIVN